MKIGDTRALRGPRAVTTQTGTTVRPAAPAGPRAATDVTDILGIPEHELTPHVRNAIVTLMAEVDRLRRDLEQSKARIEYLENLADQDSLLPLANRRAFVREVTRMIAFAERYGGPSSLLYFDIDQMKEINDKFGHAAGDAALAHVAEILVNNLRVSDVIGRLGGDEFGVILAQAGQATANEKALQLTKAIESQPFEVDGQRVELTVAVGAYTFEGGENPGEALDRADRAMYERKRKRSQEA